MTWFIVSLSILGLIAALAGHYVRTENILKRQRLMIDVVQAMQRKQDARIRELEVMSNTSKTYEVDHVRAAQSYLLQRQAD